MGSFQVDIKFADDVAIFKTSGYINDLGGERIEKECEDVLREGYRKVIINLKDSPIINSIGISILIGITDRINKADGNLFFTNVTNSNAKVFDFMGLSKYAPIFQTVEDAVRHVSGKA
ncbi:MAG: STAS domain-containing protein [bacterium]